jgi:hypothetical protein
MTAYLFLQLAGPYLALAVALGICVLISMKHKAATRQSTEQAEQAAAELRQRLIAAEDAIGRLRADLQTAEEQFRVSAGAPAKSWSNINRRTQALRMLRSGQKPQRIAAELSMTAGEIDLISKVTSIMSNNSLQTNNSAQSDGETSIFPINA